MREKKDSTQVSPLDLLVIIVVVLFSRIVVEELMPMFYESFGLYFGDFLFQTLSNVPLTLGAVVANYLAVRILVKRYPYGKGMLWRSLWEIFSILTVSFIVSVVIRMDQYTWGTTSYRFFSRLFYFTLVSNIVFNAVVTLVIDLVTYYRWSNRKAVAEEAEKRARANYQYQLLKSETNPHFLFNCLNVLQYLIHEDQDRASEYVGKLAGVYRYFLKIEKNTSVLLEEELAFVNRYNDLLRERFGSSFVTQTDIPEEYYDTLIIPCTLQMMIENAVKHNVVNSANELRICVKVEDGHIVVTNNINPKKQRDGSTNGMGLENVGRQYEMLFHEKIEVENNGREFVVRIPIIR